MSQFFDFIQTPLQGLCLINRTQIADDRGSFGRFFCAKEFSALSLNKPIAQINYTVTKKTGSIRGLHYQYPPSMEAKIITCLQGEVFDVAVDIRQDSPTFLKWHGEILNENNRSSLLVPEGFAHGFQTLTDNCHLMYLHSELYNPEAEDGINIFDPMLAIKWPLKASEVSDRDKNHAPLDANFVGVSV